MQKMLLALIVIWAVVTPAALASDLPDGRAMLSDFHGAVIAASSDPVEVGGSVIDPGLSPLGDQIFATGTLSPAALAVDPTRGFAIGSIEAPVSITPLGISGSALPGQIVNGDSALYENTQAATDTVLRPTADGVEAFVQQKSASAPDSYSWTVSLEPDEHLMQVDVHTVAIVKPSAAGTADVSPEDLPPTSVGGGNTVDAAGSVENQVATESDALSSAQDALPNGDETIAGVVSAPSALDANGEDVAITLSGSGDQVRLAISRETQVAYPVVADPQFFGFTVTTALMNYCSSHIEHCLTGLGLGLAAHDQMLRFYPHAHENGRGDAFRHCFWNEMMEHRVGGHSATAIATANESESSGFAHNMDLNNNHEGRIFWEIFGSEKDAGNFCHLDAQPHYGNFLIFRNFE